jgi:hypothetical protein
VRHKISNLYRTFLYHLVIHRLKQSDPVLEYLRESILVLGEETGYDTRMTMVGLLLLVTPMRDSDVRTFNEDSVRLE